MAYEIIALIVEDVAKISEMQGRFMEVCFCILNVLCVCFIFLKCRALPVKSCLSLKM